MAAFKVDILAEYSVFQKDEKLYACTRREILSFSKHLPELD